MTTITRIEAFLSGLDNIKIQSVNKEGIANYRKAVNSFCKKELDYLRKHVTLLSLRTVRTEYRNAIREKYKNSELLVSYTDKYGKTHIAVKYFTLKESEVSCYIESETTRKNSYLSGQTRLIICNHKEMVNKAENLLLSDKAHDIGAGLLLLTGRRVTEIYKTAEFKVIDSNRVLFSGQLKNVFCGKKAENARDNYEIPVLCNAQKIVDSLAKLRRLLSDKSLDTKTEKEVESIVSSAVGNAVKRNFGKFGYIKSIVNQSLNSLVDYPFISPKNLRSIYTHIAQHEFSPYSVITSFASDVLGHAIRQTADNYMEFMIKPKE